MTTPWDLIEKVGEIIAGWQFNEVNFSFNNATDPDSGLTAYFNGIGITTTWTNINK